MKGKIQKRERKNGTVWTAIVELPRDPKTGKRRQTRISAPTKKEVESLMAQALVGLETGYAEADIQKLTVEQYLNDWLPIAAQTLRPASYGRYEEIVRLHIVPALGKALLAKLSPLQVTKFYGECLAGGKSKTTVNNIHNMLHKALDEAVRLGLLLRNVTDLIDAPGRSRPEYITWTGEQVRAFLEVSDVDDFGALWRLAIYTGMRRGEMLGLKWEDVDMERAVLSVRRTYSRGEHGRYVLGAPKTASGRRQITLPSSVVTSLRQHRVRQVEQRLHIGEAYKDQGFVFANISGEPTHPNTLTLHFHKLIRLASLPRIRIHDLRHGHATLMMENGEHPKVVSERLGHANISITMDLYSHVTPTMQRQASDRFEKLIEGGA
jgi:integrase